MMPPLWLPRERLVGVGLKRAQMNQVPVEPQRRAVPDEAVDAIAEQRRARGIRGVDRTPAASVAVLSVQIQIDAGVAREARMQRDAEQPPFRGGVDREIERRRGLHHAVDDPLHLARCLLQDEEVASPDERHPDGLREPGDDGGDGEVRVEHRRHRGLALERNR